MDYTSARTGGLFATLPQEIILKEITSKLTIPEMYSLRVAVNLHIPRESFPALFVRWTFLPRVRFNGIEGHVVSAYNIERCISAGICNSNSFTNWALTCKNITCDLNVGIMVYNRWCSASVPLFEEEKRLSRAVTALMATMALMCNTPCWLAQLPIDKDDYILAAAILCLGTSPSINHIQVLKESAACDEAFVLDDVLIATYAEQLPGKDHLVSDYLAELWASRLPEDPKVYKILSSDRINGHVLRDLADMPSVADVVLDTCYMCQKCSPRGMLDFGEGVYIKFLKHRNSAHPHHTVYSLTAIPSEFKNAVLENAKQLTTAYDPIHLMFALKNIIHEDIGAWRVIRDNIDERTFTERLFNYRNCEQLTRFVRHLINPNGVTLSKIMHGIMNREEKYLFVAVNYGERGVHILRNPKNARRLNAALALSKVNPRTRGMITEATKA